MSTLTNNLSRHIYHSGILKWLRSDGRHFQIISQLAFLAFGIFALNWDADWQKYFAALVGTFSAQALAIHFKVAPSNSLKSALVTTLGLCLLMKANSPWLFLFAGLFAVGQKFLIRVNNKHLWNPANFGIVIMIIISGESWISPGQWGNSALLVFIIGTSGLAVLSNIKRLNIGIVFIASLLILEYCRVVLFLGWDTDVLFHKISSGSLWLFALFMITDPMTTPNSRIARIIWAIFIASISFYLANFHFINGAPFWVLFFATPITPVIDYLTKHKNFSWNTSSTNLNTTTK